MKKKYVLELAATVCLLGVNTACASQPNIIFVLLDDAGFGDMGPFWQKQRELAGDRSKPWFHTPELDAMAAEGVKLWQHYCPAPVCAPSRGSLLEGVHSGHATVRDEQFGKPVADNWTLAKVMKEAGYATAMMGKHGLEGSATGGGHFTGHPLNIGFDYFFGQMSHGDAHTHYPAHTTYSPITGELVRNPLPFYEDYSEISASLTNCYTTDLYIARAKKWIDDHRQANPSQPFFLYLPLDTPHAAFQVPTMAYPAGRGRNGGVQWIGTPGNMINTATGPIDSWVHPDYANATYDHDKNPGTAEQPWTENYKRFAGMMRRIDTGMGDLLQTLRDLGIDENTLVVISSDNGATGTSYLGGSYIASFFENSGPLRGAKRSVYDGGTRMPTLAWWPGSLPAGHVDTTPSQFQDWMATFAKLSGLPIPARTDGVNLLPSLTNTGARDSSMVYVEWENGGNDRQTILLEGYKGLRENITSHTTPWKVYDLANDIDESTDLAGNPALAEVIQKMNDTVLRVRRPLGDAPRAYDNELVPALDPRPTVQGVDWRSYARDFPFVPDLRTETHDLAGHSASLNLTVLPAVDDSALFFRGYLNVPTAGDYTFYLTTDTGAYLRLHEASVLDADYGYTGGTEISATIKLEAGLHPYRLYYLNKDSATPLLDLQWSGPGLAKQTVPNAAFLRDDNDPGPPTAIDDQSETPRDQSVLIDVLQNDFDDGTPGPLVIQSAGNPSHGTAVIEAGQIRYTPAGGYTGPDAFLYTITDGQDTDTAEVTVNVQQINPPTSIDDTAQTVRDTSVLINVLVNDLDDGTPQPLSIVAVTDPPHGSTVIVNGEIRYTPDTGFEGEDSFDYTITDGQSTSMATVTVLVQPPLADPDTILAWSHPAPSGTAWPTSYNHPNLQASTWTVGPNIKVNTLAADAIYYETKTSDGFSAVDFTAAASRGDYFEFIVTPQSGYTVDVEAYRVISNSNIQANVTLDLRYSVDSYASSVGSTFTRGGSGSLLIWREINDIGLRGLTGPITFRLYAYGGSIGQRVQIRTAEGADMELIGLVTALASGYDAWAAGFASQPVGDENGDGVPNLVAYALGATADEDARPLLPTVHASTGGATEFVLDSAPQGDVDYLIDASSNLADWTAIARQLAGETSFSIPAGVTGVTIDTSSGNIRVQDARSLTPQFYRLRIVR